MTMMMTMIQAFNNNNLLTATDHSWQYSSIAT